MPTELPHIYPQKAQEATLRLRSAIKESIQENGPMSFNTYMQLSLYHPEHGYYTRGLDNVGKSGDFFTSVSVGSCFGIILAHRIHKEWLEQAQPKLFHIVEQGANTGQLANDILDTLKSTFPSLYAVLQYHIIEHLPSVIEIQKITLADHIRNLHHHSEPTPLGENGILLSNELIDAFPVHLLQYENDQWNERMVSLDSDSELKFTLKPLSESLQKATKSIQLTLPKPPEGYQTEYRPGIETYIANTKKILTQALVITIDYGHTSSSYYTASRKTGTLRCYHQHQADENPLALPGIKDITAHVDFTQLGNALRNAGFQLTHFSSQSHYLTTHASSWLTNMEKNSTIDFKLIRQFQTLTHPTTMGHQFHIIEAHTHKIENADAMEKLEIDNLKIK